MTISAPFMRSKKTLKRVQLLTKWRTNPVFVNIIMKIEYIEIHQIRQFKLYLYLGEEDFQKNNTRIINNTSLYSFLKAFHSLIVKHPTWHTRRAGSRALNMCPVWTFQKLRSIQKKTMMSFTTWTATRCLRWKLIQVHWILSKNLRVLHHIHLK